jgi:HlyD family secretion protein
LIQAGGAAQTDRAVILLRSPISGVVLRRLWESEAVVKAGEPLIEIADPEKLEIVSDMLSTDAVKISSHDKVLIEQWGGDQTLLGRVRRVEPFGFTKISALGVEEQRVNVIIDFEDPRQAWEALGDGYRVEVRVVIWRHDSVLKIPSSSLFRNGEDWAVYTVDELTRAVLRTVKIGQRNAREAQILAGLHEGDRVIAYPGDQITEGVEVVAREQ